MPRNRITRQTVERADSTDRTIDQKIVDTYTKLWGISKKAAWHVVKIGRGELHLARHRAIYQMACATKDSTIDVLNEIVWALEKRIELELGEVH